MITTRERLPAHRRAAMELVFASVLWGFGFVAVRWGLLATGPLWLNAVRFGIACAVALPIVLSRREWRSQAGWAQCRLAIVPGICLSAFLSLQSYALQFTSVPRNSFLVVLYVVFLPLLEWPLLGRRPGRAVLVAVPIALAGASLMCGMDSGPWNRGDVWTVVAALAGALHILAVELVSRRIASPFVFNVYQSLWAGMVPFILALLFEPWRPGPWPMAAVGGVLALSLLSTLFAFVIQVRAQRVLPGSTAALLFLLESPFAVLFGILLFGEMPTPAQWAGAALILCAAMVTILGLAGAVTPQAALPSRSQPC